MLEFLHARVCCWVSAAYWPPPLCLFGYSSLFLLCALGFFPTLFCRPFTRSSWALVSLSFSCACLPLTAALAALLRHPSGFRALFRLSRCLLLSPLPRFSSHLLLFHTFERPRRLCPSLPAFLLRRPSLPTRCLGPRALRLFAGLLCPWHLPWAIWPTAPFFRDHRRHRHVHLRSMFFPPGIFLPFLHSTHAAARFLYRHSCAWHLFFAPC